MVKTENGFRAHEYEHLAATDFKEPFQGRKLYAVEGLAGVFRRYPAPKKKEQIPPGALIAIFAGGVILLGKDEQLSAELGEGGWKHDGKATEAPAVEVTPADGDGDDAPEVPADLPPDTPPDDAPEAPAADADPEPPTEAPDWAG